MRRLQLLHRSLTWWPLALIAPVSAQASGESGQMAAGYLAQLLGGLVIVILAIVALAWVMRRMPAVQGQGPALIRVLAVRNVGARERLMLIQVGEEQVLIGVTPAGMRALHTLTTPIDVAAEEPFKADFATVLNKIRRGGLGS